MKLASIFFTASKAIFEIFSNAAISDRESSLSEWVKIHFYTQRAQTTSAKPNVKLASKYHIFYHIFAVVAKIFFIMFSINVIKYSPL